MDIKDLTIKGLKRPHRILPFLLKVLRATYYLRKEGRVPFTFDVAGLTIPEFSSDIYKQVRLLQEALGNYHANCCCDIGCGLGRLTPWITEYSDEYYGVEPEFKLLQKARELYPTANFCQARAQKLPFPDGKFDLIVTWTVLQHIPPKHFLIAIKEIKRVANPKGIIIISESIGGKPSFWFWIRSIKEYEDRFKPWKMTWSKEYEAMGEDRTIMRFEK